MSEPMMGANVAPAPKCPHYIPADRAAQGMLMCRRCTFRPTRAADSFGNRGKVSFSPLPRSRRIDLVDLGEAA